MLSFDALLATYVTFYEDTVVGLWPFDFYLSEEPISVSVNGGPHLGERACQI